MKGLLSILSIAIAAGSVFAGAQRESVGLEVVWKESGVLMANPSIVLVLNEPGQISIEEEGKNYTFKVRASRRGLKRYEVNMEMAVDGKISMSPRMIIYEGVPHEVASEQTRLLVTGRRIVPERLGMGFRMF